MKRAEAMPCGGRRGLPPRIEIDLALNRSVHRLDQVSWSLAPEDGVGSVVEVVEQVLDLWAGVEWVIAVVFLVSVAPVQRP